MRTAFILMVFAALTSSKSYCQSSGVPFGAPLFLNFVPDARAGGMGDAGVATSADANALFWNPAKLTVADADFGVSTSYGGWFNDRPDFKGWFGYAAAYKKLGKLNAIGISARTFEHPLVLERPTAIRSYNDYAVGVTYARQLGRHFSMSMSLNYSQSALAEGMINGDMAKQGKTLTADIGAFYERRNKNEMSGREFTWGMGATVSNIAEQINYGGAGAYNLPAMAKVGGAISYTATGKHLFSVTADLNKLMVPTPTGSGPPTNRPLINRLLSSFSDAPGGFREEIQEIALAAGVEYWYNNTVALRGGYFGQSSDKNGSKYLTAGAGLKIKDSYTADFSCNFSLREYQVMTENYRISIGFYLGGKRG